MFLSYSQSAIIRSFRNVKQIKINCCEITMSNLFFALMRRHPQNSLSICLKLFHRLIDGKFFIIITVSYANCCCSVVGLKYMSFIITSESDTDSLY